MKWGIVLVVLVLAGCVQIVDESVNETAYTPELIKANKTVELNVSINKTTTLTVPVNNTIENKTSSVNESVNDSSITGGFAIEDLSIAAQYKMIPELETAVKASECYQVTFENASEYAIPENHIEIVKEIRFDYLGGSSFKGWILNKIVKRIKVLESETFAVLVDNGEVICLDDPKNFTVDWQKVLSK